MGYECELPQLLADREAAAAEHEAQNVTAFEPVSAPSNNNSQSRSRVKCDTCRRHHMTCNPTDRVWPQKCQRCIYKGYDCGPPRSKKEHDDAQVLDPNGGLITLASGHPRRRRRKTSEKTKAPSHSEGHFQPVVSDVLYTASADGDEESSSDGSIPAVLPVKRSTSSTAGPPPPPKRQAQGRGPPAAAAAFISAAVADDEDGDDDANADEAANLAQLKGMVRTMEEEFREVLRGEQAKHEQELSALRAKYETEFKEQRDRYEARIDDLIKILGSTIASKS